MKSTNTVPALLLQRSNKQRSAWLTLAMLGAATCPGLVQAQTAACGLPSGTTIFGMTADNKIIEYVVTTANAAGPMSVIGSVVTRNADGITTADKSVIGIDFRPADSNEAALYTVTDQG